jgi:hypothetical protein
VAPLAGHLDAGTAQTTKTGLSWICPRTLISLRYQYGWRGTVPHHGRGLCEQYAQPPTESSSHAPSSTAMAASTGPSVVSKRRRAAVAAAARVLDRVCDMVLSEAARWVGRYFGHHAATAVKIA